MNKKIVVFALGVLVLASGSQAQAQQSKKIPRIGFLSAAPSIDPTLLEGLHDLGYVEGKTIVIEHRSAEGKLERLPELAAELVRLKVDIIVTQGTPAAQAVKKATSTIPIVMATSGDPVGSGLVASLARPGGNVTGLTLISPELGGKRLEILKDSVPGLTRVAFLTEPANPASRPLGEELEVAA